ncbi:tetratricopeptide repeat protein [Deinococcus sp. KNUC1210]|uniref:tetratricopeptide repeat protein n=1 Tax=Deinococcus sp. KNUC1210 TaxID=2917691 RepID=UPI001EF11CF5|nr:tetratricopeptide repeat protein [Deinococcus sp. KNUC1210]ULH15229.1 tetratricopeptide repeat protein [Deinococcus sp. KNUC1210]
MTPAVRLLLAALLLGTAQAQSTTTTTTTTTTTAPVQATPVTPTGDPAALLAAARDLVQQARTKSSSNHIDDLAWKAAADAAEIAVRADPSNPAALQLRAQIYSDVGFWKQAETAWDAYLKVQPSDVQAMKAAAVAQYNLGYAAYARGDIRNALAPFARCQTLDPQNADCALWAGRVALESGQFAPAVAQYQQALQLRPSDKVASYFLGVAQNAGKYGPAATTAFSRAYQNLDAGSKQAALNGFKSATSAAPNFIEAWREEGRLALELNDAASAKAAYDAAVNLPGASASDRYNQGLAAEGAQVGLPAAKAFRDAYAKYQAGDKAAAEAGFQTAVNAAPGYGKAWSWLGRVQYENKNYAAAAVSYGMAVKADPNDKTSAYYLKLSQAGK